MKKDKKGFTLVEMMIVIAIIALLLVIAIPSILLIRNRINNRQYNTKVELILDAAELYGKDKYSILFADGSTTATIRVIDLVPTYLEADQINKDPTTGATLYNVTDPRNTAVSMNEYQIYLVIRNSRVVATMDENSINADDSYDPNDLTDPRNPNSPYNPNNPNYIGGLSPEDRFDFSNGHIIVVAYLDGELFTTTHCISFPKPSEAELNYTKSRCNAGATLTVSTDSVNDKYKASVSNINKQTICMLYFKNTSGETITADTSNCPTH